MSINDFGPLFAVMSSCTWAYGSSVYSKLSSKYPAYTINTTRALIAAPVFTGIVFFSTNRHEILATFQTATVGWAFLSILASYAIADVLFFISSTYIGISTALAIASGFPIWSALSGVVLRGDILSPLNWCGILLTVAGTAIVILNGAKHQNVDRKKKILGFNLAIFTSFFWAVNVYSVSEASRISHPLLVSSLRMIIALVLTPTLGLLSQSFLKTKSSAILVPWSGLRPYLPAFFIESIGGTFLYSMALKSVSIAVGAVLTSLAPVISVPIAVLLKLEKFSLAKTIGIITVVLGIAFLSIK